MVPETGEARAVRLYRASEFPIRWELVGNLLSGSPNVDSSLIYYHDQWWMFTVDNDDQDRLRLYRAEGIEGPWVEHPKSPVVSGNPHIARPAGRLVEHEGRLFRFAQDDFPEYGRHVWAIEITHLTEAEYSERLFLERPILRGRRFGWNARGMHHIDPHMLDDKRWIASVDGYRRVLSIFSPTRE